jgi:hypothetical protein
MRSHPSAASSPPSTQCPPVVQCRGRAPQREHSRLDRQPAGIEKSAGWFLFWIGLALNAIQIFFYSPTLTGPQKGLIFWVLAFVTLSLFIILVA